MNCANHTDVPAAAYCRTCGKALCENCKRDVNGVIYCETHAQNVAPSADAVRHAPSPGLAAVLALIPGVGAMYNGQFKKGVAHLIAFAILIGTASIIGPVTVPFFFFFFFYLIFDAYKTARAKELGQPLPDPFGMSRFWGLEEEGTDWASAGVPIGAVVLIALGCIFLLNNMGWVHFHGFHRFWPVILIALGVWIYARRNVTCTCVRCRCRGLMGPAILVTLGVLLLLSTLYVKDFDETWPLLLIVIGVVKVLQASGPTTGHVDVSGGPSNPQLPGDTTGSHQEVSNA